MCPINPARGACLPPAGTLGCRKRCIIRYELEEFLVKNNSKKDYLRSKTNTNAQWFQMVTSTSLDNNLIHVTTYQTKISSDSRKLIRLKKSSNQITFLEKMVNYCIAFAIQTWINYTLCMMMQCIVEGIPEIVFSNEKDQSIYHRSFDNTLLKHKMHNIFGGLTQKRGQGFF